jgi:hypothetical protein
VQAVVGNVLAVPIGVLTVLAFGGVIRRLLGVRVARGAPCWPQCSRCSS